MYFWVRFGCSECSDCSDCSDFSDYYKMVSRNRDLEPALHVIAQQPDQTGLTRIGVFHFQVAEEGTHEELVSVKGGVYSALVKRQLDIGDNGGKEDIGVSTPASLSSKNRKALS